ncbi:DUF4194 domain-containing protein [Reyranella sp.]|jgi:hypothetical protein|uniref:DUF4194 domain-containing protein n=1 Tax=Reyranella sp. TaxID=1929291 RepID=UPI004036E779
MIVSRWAARQANQDPNVTAEQLTETANRLLYRQFITRGDPGGGSHFDRIVGNLDYFKDLFASFGFRFIFNDGWGYVGYVSPTAFNNMRVPTQETIVLLCLRLLYNEGAEKGYFVNSTAEILVDEDEIQTVFSSMGSRSLKPGELRAILTTFKRQGLITFDQTHSLQVAADITIRPTITEAVDESFLARLEAWGGSSSNKDSDGQEEPDSDGAAESDALPETPR